MPCENGGRDWSNVFVRQGIPWISGNHQKLGEKLGADSPSEPLEGTNLAETLILNVQPPEL